MHKFFIGYKYGKLFIKESLAINVINKDDLFLTKQALSTFSISNHLSSKAFGLLLDYKNNLQPKYDRATTNTTKDRLEKN